MSIKVTCPYKDLKYNNWYKGCVHSHSLTGWKRPEIPPKYLAEFMQKIGFDFLIVTDHDRRIMNFSWSKKDWQCELEGFILIKGLEASQPIGHICVLGCMFEASKALPTDEKYIFDVYDKGYPVVLNHPHTWRGNESTLLGMPIMEKINGIEIYSGSRIIEKQSSGLTTDIWDTLLSCGKIIWGVAAPDCHSFHIQMPDSPLNGYQMVAAANLNEADILESYKNGLSYASNGICVNQIEVTDGFYHIVSENATKIRFIGKNGVILKEEQGAESIYYFKGDEGYVRAELENQVPCFKKFFDYTQHAWLQPAFIQS